MATENPPVSDVSQTLAVRQYTLVSLSALLVMVLLLLEKNMGEWSMLPAAVGCIALLLHLRSGPVLVLLMLIWLLLGQPAPGLDPLRVARFVGRGRFVEEPTGLVPVEMALAATVLIYTLGFFRALALVDHLFPIDSRRKRLKLPAGAHLEKRTPDSVEQIEVPLLVGVGFFWSVVAWLFWQWLASEQPLPGFYTPEWRGLILFWLMVGGLLLSSALLSYLSQIRAGAEANAISLQDQLWQQTRREQSRINRWLVWARLRWQRRKEGE